MRELMETRFWSASRVTGKSLAETAETSCAVHPMGETAKLRTAVSVHCLRLAVFGVKRQIGRGRRGALCERSVAHARQPGCSMPSLELGRRAIGGEHLALRPDRGVHLAQRPEAVLPGGPGAACRLLSAAPTEAGWCSRRRPTGTYRRASPF